jgi:molecular chaperone GrpE (heat shock protein)
MAAALVDVARPLLVDIILLIDRVETNLPPSSTTGSAETQTILATIRDELLEILARRSVEPVVCVENAAFDPHLQRAISVEPTSRPSEHNLTHFVRRGYQADGQLLRPEDVVVLRHTPLAETEPTLL